MIDLSTGLPEKRFSKGHSISRPCLACSPDGLVIACGFNAVFLWQLPHGRELGSLDRASDALAFAPGGRYLALNEGRTTWGAFTALWLVRTRAKVLDLKWEWRESHVGALGFSPDGRYLAVGANVPGVRIWLLPREHRDPPRAGEGKRVR